MGIKRTWKFQKLSTLSLPPKLREDIIHRIIRRQGSHPITLYAWQVKEGVAAQAFVTKAEVLGDWAKHRGMSLLREGTEFPDSIKVVKWTVEINDMISHIHEGKLSDLKIPTKQWSVLDATVPSSLFEDLSSIAAKAGIKRP